MRRILYYCQSLVGVGHLACSLRIIRELLGHAEVDLVHGGLDTPEMFEHPGFRTLRLPTLLHDDDSGGFVAPEHEAGLDAMWALRRVAIASFLKMPYDAVVVEFYPFGRRRFKAEILGLLADVRERCGPVPVFCSVREVLVPRPVENERRMVESVRKHIHTVFVRSDPAVIDFAETFSLAHEIGDRIVHTGYIGPAAPAVRPPRRPQVLVSVGGGNVGRELLEAAIGAAALMPRLHVVLATGSRMPEAEREALRASARSGNVEVLPFLADFPQRLMESACSISMGGDNTLLEVLTARTPALAWPYQGTPEQGIRIGKFARKGLLTELSADDLRPERLRDRIEQAMAAPYPALQVATDGARVTSEHIRAVLERR